MKDKKIYITGMTSAQNPSSGVGLSRSIRKAFPQLTLVGVDHWQGSSGLHDTSVDETLILPRWGQIDDKVHAARLRKILDNGNLWIAAMDMEVHWLAKHLGEHENLMAPNAYALEMTGKPAVKALEGLDFKVPEWIPASLPDSEIHSFMRHSSWQCWLKSPYHEARRVSSWGGFIRNRDAMSANWKTSKLFVQRNMSGNEETVAFAAYKGELLAAAHMEKRLITPEGKTWGARVTKPSPEFHEQLAVMVKKMNWSGGGEIEYMRDPDGQKWVIEWNPRFPAWMFGAALAGINLQES